MSNPNHPASVAAGAMPGEGHRGTSFIAPGAMLGVMGGGQLARMFGHAAQQMGYAVAVLDPDPASPAGAVAHRHVMTGYLDPQGLATLAECSAAVTTEFENVPAEALQTLAATRPVAPSAAAVAVCQDRAAEKALFVRSGVGCAPHALIETAAQLAAVDDDLLPGILKTNRLGYDGKGQTRVADRTELAAAWDALRAVPCLLEKRLPLLHEISVVVARSSAGDTVHLPVQRNLHRAGILAVTQVPAPDLPPELAERAIDGARRLADALGYVGVMCVEFFVLAGRAGEGPALVVNEIAPRPHNSGHHSIDTCDLSQFDLQVRAMVGAPLVAPRQHSPGVMLNLLGDLWFAGNGPAQEPDWAAALAVPGVHLHLYGKAEARPGRKMGHLTVTAPTADEADRRARRVAAGLGIDAW